MLQKEGPFLLDDQPLKNKEDNFYTTKKWSSQTSSDFHIFWRDTGTLLKMGGGAACRKNS